MQKIRLVGGKLFALMTPEQKKKEEEVKEKERGSTISL